MKKLHVIGAGFSGLSLAYFLKKEGFEVEVFEKNPVSGGMISTHRTPHGMVESAANAFVNSKLLEDLAKEIDVELIPANPEAERRYIFRDGRPRKMPVTLGARLRLLGAAVRYFVARGGLRPRPLESIRAWGRRILGDEATEFVLVPALQGVFAGDADRLSARLILEPVLRRRWTRGPSVRGSVAPRNGMAAFLSALHARLVELQVPVHCGVKRETFEKGVLSVYCGPAAEAPGLPRPIETVPLVTATLFFPPDERLEPGFGTLFPPNERFWSLGVLYNHCIFEGRGDGISETWIAGGALNPSAVGLSDQAITEKILIDRARLHGLEAAVQPLSVSITKWERAIPHYTVELEELIGTGFFKPDPRSDVLFFGNYQGALGLTKILERARDFARELKKASS